MNEVQQKQYLKEKKTLVITRSCKTKEDEKAELKEYQVGTEVAVANLFGDELVSLGKAVVKDSLQHKQWLKIEAEKAVQKKSAAAKKEEVKK